MENHEHPTTTDDDLVSHLEDLGRSRQQEELLGGGHWAAFGDWAYGSGLARTPDSLRTWLAARPTPLSAELTEKLAQLAAGGSHV